MRPVSVSTLKSTGPMRSVCTVFSANCLENSEGRFALLVDDAAQHRAGDGALGRARRTDDEHVLAAQQRQLELGEEPLALEEGLLELAEESPKVAGGVGEVDFE